MGKHGATPPRPDRDLFPTPAHTTLALLQHIDVSGCVVWEPAAGTGAMAAVLKDAGAKVYCSDVHRYGYRLDELLDFVGGREPKLRRFDWIITNPPGGSRNTLAVKFIELGLPRLQPGGGMAMLLPIDFDSAVGRAHIFEDCPEWHAKIVLRGRSKWFENPDPNKSPKENHC
jgi:hypothetical protein